MTIRIYQHWIGQMVAEAGILPPATHSVDAWFPAEKPAGAVLVGRDVYPTPTIVFPKLIRLGGKVGPIRLHLNVNLAFRGTVEHWQAPIEFERGPPPGGLGWRKREETKPGFSVRSAMRQRDLG